MATPQRFQKFKTAIELALEGYALRLAALLNQLHDSSPTVFLAAADKQAGQSDLHCVTSSLSAMDFDHDVDEPQQGDLNALQAVVACGPVTMGRVAELNQAKKILKQCFTEITNYRVTVGSERLPLALVILRDLGRPRLDRTRVYRQIVILEDNPDTIGFSRSQLRTVARRSTEQVLAWLSQRSEEETDSFRAMVSALPFNEPLALVKGRYLNQRANVRVGSQWSMVQAHLPLFIPQSPSHVPVIRYTTRAEPGEDEVQERSDKQLCAQPLFTLGAVAVYQYRNTA